MSRLVGRLGLDGRVELVGRVEGQAKHRLLRRAQLVCMPSRYETFGIVAAEALATGTPVLIFAIPCLREVVSEATGRLVPPGDTDGFAKAMRALALDPGLCERLGVAGRESVRTLCWDDIARRQEEVYVEALRVSGG